MHDHAFMLYTVILKNISIYIYTFHTIPLNILCIDIYIYPISHIFTSLISCIYIVYIYICFLL